MAVELGRPAHTQNAADGARHADRAQGVMPGPRTGPAARSRRAEAARRWDLAADIRGPDARMGWRVGPNGERNLRTYLWNGRRYTLALNQKIGGD